MSFSSLLSRLNSSPPPSHPYYPRDLVIDGYVPQVLDYTTILGGFALAAMGVGCVAVYLGARCHHLSRTDRLVLVWMLISGLIHLVIEGTYAFWSGFYRDTTGNFLAEIWKEYSKADSRYISYDPFIISMETITAAIDGPLCLLTAYAMCKDLPFRHPIQLVVSVMQLYGDVLYYWTALLEGVERFSVPGALYYWVYFVFMNCFWIIVPFLCIVQSVGQITATFTAAKRKGKSGKIMNGNGRKYH